MLCFISGGSNLLAVVACQVAVSRSIHLVALGLLKANVGWLALDMRNLD